MTEVEKIMDEIRECYQVSVCSNGNQWRIQLFNLQDCTNFDPKKPVKNVKCVYQDSSATLLGLLLVAQRFVMENKE